MKILVGMSGGLDSTYTAYRLKEEGHTVVGAVLRMTDETDISAAKTAAREIGIPLHVIDMRTEFSRFVEDPFAASYAKGETPNPCVECNRFVKIEGLCRTAEALGFDRVATGHYARIAYDGITGRYFVRRGADLRKDQSYMLWKLTQKQLSMLITPLHDTDKAIVRETARKLGWSSASAGESQDICFLPDGNYIPFVEARTGRSEPGDFIDENGNVVGRHAGIIRYTVGQRKGLGIALGHPVFVTEIDHDRNTVRLAPAGGEYMREVTVREPAFQKLAPEKLVPGLPVRVKIRYAAQPADAVVSSWEDEKITLSFASPQRAVTPGQSAVLYGIGEEQNDLLLGGIIRK